MPKLTKNEERWIGFATLIVAIYIIYQNPLSSSSWLISALLVAFGASNSSEIRNIFKLTINFIFKKEVFHVERSTKSINIGKIEKSGEGDINIIQSFGEKTKHSTLDKIKIDILNFLNSEFNKNAHNFIGSSTLIKETGLTMNELTPHIKYLEGKNYIKAKWFLGGNFICQITSGGIDILNSV